MCHLYHVSYQITLLLGMQFLAGLPVLPSEKRLLLLLILLLLFIRSSSNSAANFSGD